MQKLIFLILAMLLPVIAHAEASLSSDAGRSIDNSQSSTIKRDKSLSADKSRGNRASESESRDRSAEKSLSKSHQKSTGTSSENSKSYTVDININGLLLREFTARYERGNSGAGAAWDYFHTCKPMMNSITDYPVKDMSTGGVAGRNEAMKPKIDSNGRGYLLSAGDGGLIISFVDPQNKTISRYAQCRMTASYWLAEAGDRSASQKVTSEAEVRSAIQSTFNEMDSDSSLFELLRQQARDIWEQASCSNWLDDYKSFKDPRIECGIFSFVGKSFTVENRETLSEASIDGRTYKVAVAYQNTESEAEERSASADAKVSTSVSQSESRERYRESKRTASLNKSKSTDTSSSSKVDRSTGNSINATPK